MLEKKGNMNKLLASTCLWFPHYNLNPDRDAGVTRLATPGPHSHERVCRLCVLERDHCFAAWGCGEVITAAALIAVVCALLFCVHGIAVTLLWQASTPNSARVH